MPGLDRGDAHADFAAAGLDDQRHGFGGAAILRIAAGGGAAGVVAVEAVAPVGVKLGRAKQLEGAEDDAQFRTGLAGSGMAAVVLIELTGQGSDVGTDFVAAQADGRAQPVEPLRAGLKAQAQRTLADAVFANRLGPTAVFGVVQADGVNAILPELQAGADLGIPPVGAEKPALSELAAPDRALVGLFVLVALQAVDIAGGCRKEIQRVVDDVQAGLAGAAFAGSRPVSRQAVTVGLAAIVGRQIAVAANFTALDGALGHMLGGGPVGTVEHAGQREAVVGGAGSQAEQAVVFLQVLFLCPWAVVAAGLEGPDQVEIAEAARAGGQQAPEIVLAEAEVDKAVIQPAQVVDAGAAGGAEVTIRGGIDALAVVDAADQLRHQEVEIHVALAVCMADHIGRHAHHRRREIAAMVEIEAAQEVLVGLAVAGVLGNDHAGDGFQRFCRPQQGAVGQLPAADGPFGGAVGNAGQVLFAAADGDLLQCRQTAGVGKVAGGEGQRDQGAPERRGLGVVHGETPSTTACRGRLRSTRKMRQNRSCPHPRRQSVAIAAARAVSTKQQAGLRARQS